MKLEFSRKIFRIKTQKISNFIKILLVKAELFHADGRMDRRDESNSRFSQFRERAWKRIEKFQPPNIWSKHERKWRT